MNNRDGNKCKHDIVQTRMLLLTCVAHNNKYVCKKINK